MRVAVVACLLLAGCSRGDDLKQADRQVLCSQSGHAFYVQPGAGDVSFVTRTPSADAICKGMTK